MGIRIKNLFGTFVAALLLALSCQALAEDTLSDNIVSKANVSKTGDLIAPAVIVHPETTITTLSLNHLRAIFSLRVRQWPDGTPIKVIVLHDHDHLHRLFLRETLKMLPHQLRRQWDRYIYSGTGQGPMEVASIEELEERVNNIPGAIGYSQTGVAHDHQVIQVH